MAGEYRLKGKGSSAKTIRKVYDALVRLDGEEIGRKELGLLTNTQYYSLNTTLDLLEHMGLVEVIGRKIKYARIKK